MKKLLLYLLLPALLLSCGVKKHAVQEEQQTVKESLSLEQRIASGEFAWLDTIQGDTAKFPKLVGAYKLVYQKDLNGNNLTIENVQADSLILSNTGFYWLYKNDSLVDYGKYNISPYQRAIKICMEQYKPDIQTGKYTDEIITYEGYWGVWGVSQIYFSFISCNFTTTTYLGLYSYDSSNNLKLQFHVKIGDCYHYQWSGSNQIEWKRIN